MYFFILCKLDMEKILAFFAVKKILILLLMALMLYQQQRAYSQALPPAPVANFVMNRAIGGVLTRVAVARGFAANDPRIAATLAGAGSAMTGVNVASSIAGVGLAIAGAPVWLTVAAGLGVFAVGSAIVTSKASLKLGNDGLTIDTSGSVVSQPYTYTSGNVPQYFPWVDELARGVNIYRLPDCFPSQACYAFPSLPSGTIPFQKQPYTQDTSVGSVVFVYWSVKELSEKYLPQQKVYDSTAKSVTVTYKWAVEPHYEKNANGVSRLVAVQSVERICSRGTCLIPQSDGSVSNPDRITSTPETRPWDSEEERIVISPVARPNTFKNLDEASPSIPDDARKQPISPDVLAKLADQAWMKAAAQPGYQGIPYSATQPITKTDVVAWQSENSSKQPTLGDLLTPANNPGVSNVPISQSVVADSPSQNPNAAVQNVAVVNAPKVDLGADPGIAAPNVDAPPAVVESLAPLLFLFPELKSYQTPQHVAECPKPKLSVFGKAFVMDTHCVLAENHRLSIASVMAVVWTIVGIFILLSA
jgi:hypothetical protein